MTKKELVKVFRNKYVVFCKTNLTILKDIIEATFNESCRMYIDIIDENNKSLEFHFDDCNYYEIEISNTDTVSSIGGKIISNLIDERLVDRRTTGINRNNERYFKKYKI